MCNYNAQCGVTRTRSKRSRSIKVWMKINCSTASDGRRVSAGKGNVGVMPAEQK